MPKVVDTAAKLFGKDPYKGVNPDEAVAVGAAIQAGILRGDFSSVLLLDVTPLSLGIETVGGVFTRLIPRNTTIPVRKSQIFSTASDAQTEVDIKVLQGEREMASDNKLLAQFKLPDLPPLPKGVPQIEVTFDIDANGIVKVSAKDKATGKEKDVRVQSSGGLSDKDIQRILEEAERNRENDAKQKEVTEVKNHAESVVYDTEKNMKTYKDTLKQEDVTELNTKIAHLRKLMADNNDSNAIREATNDVQSFSMKAFEVGYKAQAQQQASKEGGGDQHAKPGQDEPIDADFKDVNDKTNNKK